MENASKALIIAGTALILILIISAGMLLFNKAGNLSNSARVQWTEDEVNSFNDQFEKFGGEQSGSRVKELITEVNRSNKAMDVRVEINNSAANKSLDGVYYPASSIINGNTYNITFERDNNNRITVVNINN